MKIDTNTICGCEDNDFCVKFSENIGVLSEKAFNHLYEFNTYEDLLSGIITSGLIILPSQGDSGVVGVKEPDTTKRGVYMYDNGVWKMYVDTYSEDIIAELNQKSTATNLENGTGTGSLVQKRLKSDGVTWTTTKAYQGASTAFGGGTQAGRTEAEFNAYFWDSTKNVPLNGGAGKNSSGEILDNRSLTYKESYSFSVAEGEQTKALGRGSHSEGYYTETEEDYSHAEGWETISRGLGSHAEGDKTQTIGNFSHAEGFGTTSKGACSHAEGMSTVAIGDKSHTEGFATRALEEFQHVEGKYNADNPNALHIVGNGTSDTDRKNAFEVLEDGRAKVQSAPVDDDDVVRKIELNTLDTKINELYVSQEMAATLF